MRAAPTLLALSALLLGASAAQAHEKQSAHYAVECGTSQRDADLIAARMEEMFQAYGRFLGPLELGSGERFSVRIFATKAAYEAFGTKHGFKGDRFRYLHSVGNLKRVVVGWRIPEPALLMRLRHEAFHQYFRRLIPYPPHWLNEGLAEVFEASLLDGGGRVSVRVNAPMHRRLREGVLKVDRGPLGRKGYRRIEVSKLVGLTKREWLQDADSAYCQSWGLAHFLLVGEGGARAKTLSAVIASLSPEADEAGNLAASQAALRDLGGLSRAFQAWAKGTPVPGGESYARGKSAFDKQDYAAAERALSEALEADPLNPRYAYLRAQSRYSQSKLDLARADIENAIAYAPEDSVYYLSLGKISTFRKAWPEAKWALEKAKAMGLGKHVAKYLAKIPAGTRARRPSLEGTAQATGSAAPELGSGRAQPARPKPARPAPPKPARPAPPEPAAGFAIGPVAAKWRNGKWYSAAIKGSGAKAGTFRVLYDDGTKEKSVPPARLRHLAQPGEISVGDAVLAVWKKAQMWPGKVQSVDDQGVLVRWDDKGTQRIPWGKFFKP